MDRLNAGILLAQARVIADEERRANAMLALNDDDPLPVTLTVNPSFQDVHTLWVRGLVVHQHQNRRLLALHVSPATGTETKFHGGAIPVFAAREALVGGVEVNRLHQLRPHAGALCHNTLHTHQGT